MTHRKTHRRTGGSMHHPEEETPMEIDKKRGGVARHHTTHVRKKDGGHMEHPAEHRHSEGMEMKKKGGSVKHHESKDCYARGGEAKKWIQKAINPKNKGALREALHVKKGEKIPETKLEKAEHSRDPLTRKRAMLAETLRGFERHKKGGRCSS